MGKHRCYGKVPVARDKCPLLWASTRCYGKVLVAMGKPRCYGKVPVAMELGKLPE
jgi:hypothetical protein